MIVLAAKYVCKKGAGDAVEALLRDIKPLVEENEKGCLLYTVNRSMENSDMFLMYEQYVDQDALEAHRETPHFKEIIEGKIIPLLEKREREFYTLL